MNEEIRLAGSVAPRLALLCFVVCLGACDRDQAGSNGVSSGQPAKEPATTLASQMAGELASELASELATEISTAGLAERFANNRATLVLDVRTADEFESGHIPGATNIPHTELQSRLSEVSDAQDIVVYCEAGGRARTAIAVLSGSGYTRVMHLDGDMRAWRKDGLAVARGESAISDAAL